MCSIRIMEEKREINNGEDAAEKEKEEEEEETAENEQRY